MILNGSHLGKFLEALEASFDAGAMAIVLKRRFNLAIDNITGAPRWPNKSQEIYQYFEMKNEVEKLVAACRDARPSVPEFAIVADSIGFATFTDDTGAPVSAEAVRTNFEALLAREKSPYADVIKFRGDLSKLEGQVCRIAAGTLSGTGVLVAPDLVMTNRHVMTSVISTVDALTGAAACIFDDKKGGSEYSTPTRRVAVRKVLAASPHAPEDLVAGPATHSMSCLDYAVLRLAEPVGDQPVADGGEGRGHVDLTKLASGLAAFSGLVVLQHPKGQPMKIDIGAVLEVAGTRFRHSVNTEGGSSGAPVFDASLNLAGLHHMGSANGPGESKGYNQAVPFQLILEDARSKGVAV